MHSDLSKPTAKPPATRPVQVRNLDCSGLGLLVAGHEEWLMAQVLGYARRQGYTRYTSTLLEAWRASIVGLSTALRETLERFPEPPEFGPDDDFRADPSAAFGILEAQLHRNRGVTLAMFLGLMKYYRQSYQDLVTAKVTKRQQRRLFRLYLDRFFDRVELGYSSEWLAASEGERLTELQVTNRALTNEKNKYLTIFESISSPVILVDANDRVENLNQQAAVLFTAKATPGGHYYRGADQSAPVWPWLSAALAELTAGDGVTLGLELELETSSGRRRFQLQLKRMLDISGKFTGTVAILNDVSELRYAEEKMNKLLENLQRSNNELENFAYIASHDLQEPLRMVTSYLQLLERRCGDFLDPDAREFLNFAVDGARRMKTLILDLLAYSRAGSSTRPFVETDLNEVLEQVLKNLGPAITESGAQIDVPELPQLVADRTQMVQLFQNLLSNAIKFHGEQPPHIRIAVKDAGHAWRFAIRDNGIGIDPRYHERVFALFQRLHGREDVPGTGIGLALCRKIVERHGGKIGIEGSEGAGSTFHFTLDKEYPDDPRQEPADRTVDGRG